VIRVPTLAVEDIDLSDIEFWGRPPSERDSAFALLRAERPIAFFEEPDLGLNSALALTPGHGYRVLTRHADVTEVSRNPDLYCSGKGALTIIDLPEEMVDFFAGMISTDNPRHARLRSIVSAAFSPRQIRAIEESIERVAVRLIVESAGLGGCDLVTSFAAPLSLEIICNMMGVPASEHATVRRCSNVISSSSDVEYLPEGNDSLLAIFEAAQELSILMADLANHRLTHPTDDLTTALVMTNIDGEALTESELASFFILMLIAGNETTRDSISHGILALSEHPDQRALWQADPVAVAATGIEEVVRWASPVNWMRRTVTADTVLSGEELHDGDKVILLYPSANRDEEVFEDPFRFDVLRNPNPHVGFGASGPHFCLGAHLARREIDVMLRELLTRLPDIEACGEPTWTQSRSVNGIKHLPCSFTPVAPST
jgi:cytochrome P450